MASLIVAAAASLAWCFLAIRVGPKIGYLDRPDGSTLKVHRTPSVPLGGVGVFIGIHLAALVRGAIDPALLWATTIVLILGLVDDRRGLAPVLRLFVETVAAVVLVVGIMGWEDGVVRLVLGAGLVVLAVNAVNLFDGLDGLAGSAGLVSALGLAWLAVVRGLPAQPSLELAAALAGFLILGWHPARVFLGDSGAYVTGLALAASMIRVSPGAISDLLVASALLGVFALDLIVTLIRRRRNHRPLFEGDRSHVYDQLRDRGMSVPGVALLAAAAQGIVVVVVLAAGLWLSPVAAVLAVVATTLLWLVLMVRLGFLRVDPA